MIVLQQVNFYKLVQAAMKVEKSEASSRERFQKRQFSRGASSSSGKRARESQDVLVQGSATRGRRQGSTVVTSSGRGVSTGQGEVPECPHCHKRHLGVCRLLTRGCFICGSTEHWMANCPRELGDNRSLQWQREICCTTFYSGSRKGSRCLDSTERTWKYSVRDRGSSYAYSPSTSLCYEGS